MLQELVLRLYRAGSQAVRMSWRAMQCFRSFHTARLTLEGVEALNMMGKGQVMRLDGLAQRPITFHIIPTALPQKSKTELVALCHNLCYRTQGVDCLVGEMIVLNYAVCCLIRIGARWRSLVRAPLLPSPS